MLLDTSRGGNEGKRVDIYVFPKCGTILGEENYAEVDFKLVYNVTLK